MQQTLIQIFEEWGTPEWIKVDNGRPLGDPGLELVPVLSLWLIGFGIKVIWNRPATPQDNAVVERNQGVMGKWTEYARCSNTEDLRIRLKREAHFYNFHFPIRRKDHKTRIELYPTLRHTGRYWTSDYFDLKRVLRFLAKGYWERKVSKTGQIYIYGQRFSVGTRYKHQKVSVKLDPGQNQWNVFSSTGELIKEHPTPFTKQKICSLDLS